MSNRIVAGGTAVAFSGRRLRELRSEREISREALALAVGRSWTSVGVWERGQVIPPTPVVCRLAAALGVSVADLFEPL